MAINRQQRLLRQGLPGNPGFLLEDLSNGDLVQWNSTTKKWDNITVGSLESSLNHDNLTGFVANEHIDHTSVTLTAGTGLTGGGDISANRTFNCVVATTSAQGIGEIATQTEVDTGTDTTRWVTPDTLSNYSGLGGAETDTKYKTADQTYTTNTTMTDDTHLTGIALDTADAWYKLEGFLIIESGNTPDFKLQFVFTNAPQDGSYSVLGRVDTFSTGASYGDSVHTATGLCEIAFSSNQTVGFHVHGFFRSNATTGGTFKLQHAQRSSGALTTGILTGSWLTVTRIS